MASAVAGSESSLGGVDGVVSMGGKGDAICGGGGRGGGPLLSTPLFSF